MHNMHLHFALTTTSKGTPPSWGEKKHKPLTARFPLFCYIRCRVTTKPIHKQEMKQRVKHTQSSIATKWDGWSDGYELVAIMATDRFVYYTVEL